MPRLSQGIQNVSSGDGGEGTLHKGTWATAAPGYGELGARRGPQPHTGWGEPCPPGKAGREASRDGTGAEPA